MFWQALAWSLTISRFTIAPFAPTINLTFEFFGSLRLRMTGGVFQRRNLIQRKDALACRCFTTLSSTQKFQFLAIECPAVALVGQSPSTFRRYADREFPRFGWNVKGTSSQALPRTKAGGFGVGFVASVGFLFVFSGFAVRLYIFIWFWPRFVGVRACARCRRLWPLDRTWIAATRSALLTSFGGSGLPRSCLSELPQLCRPRLTWAYLVLCTCFNVVLTSSGCFTGSAGLTGSGESVFISSFGCTVGGCAGSGSRGETGLTRELLLFVAGSHCCCGGGSRLAALGVFADVSDFASQQEHRRPQNQRCSAPRHRAEMAGSVALVERAGRASRFCRRLFVEHACCAPRRSAARRLRVRFDNAGRPFHLDGFFFLCWSGHGKCGCFFGDAGLADEDIFFNTPQSAFDWRSACAMRKPQVSQKTICTV